MAYDPNYQQPEAVATSTASAPYGIDFSQSGWSPEVQDYATQLEAMRRELWQKYAGQNTGLDNPDFLTPMQVQQPASDEIRTEYMPEEVVRAFMAKYPTISEAAFNPGADVISYGGSRDPSVYDMVRLPYGGGYTYTDKATGKSVTLSTPEELGAFARSRNLATGGGDNVANWEITDPTGNRLAYDLPYTPSFLKQAGQTIADLAVEYGLPMLATAGLSLPAASATKAASLAGTTALAQGAGMSLAEKAAIMAAASGLGKALKTGDLEQSLLAGLKGAGSTIGMAYLSPYISQGLTSAGLDFPGMDYLFPSTSPDGLFTPGGGSFYIDPATGVETARVLAPSFSGFGGLTAAALSSLGQLPSIPDAYSASADDGVEKVTVPGTRVPTAGVSPLPIAASALTDLNYDTGEQLGYGDKPTTEAPKEEGPTFNDYLRYLSLGLTGASLLGGLFGGESKTGAGGTIPAGLGGAGKLPASFSAKLPTGSAIPAYGGGVTPQARAARTATDLGDIDWNRYGFYPERSFFANVPKRAAKGGAMAAKPISDGRSDDIPAVLSDGEYVIDAETVALLGNGSNKAGAQQLDRFRANIRKHKGKELSKGRFSVNAKKPQAYLAGGRT